MEGKLVTIRPMQLNEAEETVWNDAREGKQTIITEKQVVRAEFIEGLLLGEELTRKGLHIRRARITGELDFNDGQIRVPINLEACEFEKAPNFERASLWSLSLSGSSMPALNLYEIQVKHDVDLSGAKVTGKVRLVRATIGGNLNCERASFKNDKGTALSMDGAAIVGTVVLPLLALEDVSALEDAETLGTFDLRGMECAQLKFITDDTGSSTQELSTRVLLLGAKFSEVEVVSDETAGKRASSHSVRHRITGSYHLNSPGGKVIRRLLLAQQSDSAPSEGRDTGGRGEIYPTIYDYTARVLRDTGKEQLADQILIEKYRQLRRQRPWYLRLSGLLSDLTIGYGYRPSLILIWVLAVYVLSVVVLSLALSHNGIVATPLSSSRYVPSPLVHSDSYPVFSPWNYAFGSLLIPFVHLPGVDAWRANAANGWGVAVRVIKWVEPVVLWVLIVILGANSTRIISRDR